MQDQEAIEKIKLGEKDALAQVYVTYRNYVINWITHKHSCSLEEAKDIYQDAILIFYNNVVKGKITSIDSSIGTYLCEVVKRQLFGKLRKDAKMSRGFIDLLRDSADSDPEDQRNFEIRLELVHAGVQQLGDSCKELIRLTYFNKLSMETISQELGYKNHTTAKNLKYKCMQQLRKIVKKLVKHQMQI